MKTSLKLVLPNYTSPIVRRRTRSGVLNVIPRGDVSLIAPPDFGDPWPMMGGLFVGGVSSPDDDRARDYWLVVSRCHRVLPWYAAMTWACDLRVNGIGGWTLPSRAEMSLMYTTSRKVFKLVPHWTKAQLAWDSSEAFSFDFKDGFCTYLHDTSEGLIARAVRRIPMLMGNDE